eukprot:gene12294-13562_t
MAKAFYRFYLHSMNTKPWITTIISTGSLVGVGDIIAQQIVEKRGLKNHDVMRTTKMAGIGFCLIGPGLRTWYIILDKLVKGTGGSTALKKMAMDQLIWAPSFLVMFFSAVNVLNGKSAKEMKEVLKHDYLNALKVNYCIWPAVQLMNFYFIPMKHRVMVVNFVALFWNTYLAYASNKGQHKIDITNEASI